MIRAILFDNDGVLVDTESIFFESNRIMMREFGVELDEVQFAEMSLGRGMSLADIIVGLGYSPGTAQNARSRRNIIYDAMLAERGASLVIPNVPEVLTRLHKDFAIGVVTCCQEVHFKTIHAASGLLPYFDFIVNDSDFVHHKPHPEPYLTALRKAGLRPEETIAVEDSERGVLSAVNAGLRVAAIPRGISRYGSFDKATWRFSSILDFSAFLHTSA